MNVVYKVFSQLDMLIIYLTRFNVRLNRHAQIKFSLRFPCNLSWPNNSTNPATTDMNQAVLANIRLSLCLPKMIVKI